MKNKKLNIIDVVLILIIILVVAAVSLRAINANHVRDTQKNKDIIYTVEVYNVESIYKNALSAGDKIYLSQKSLYCGTVKTVNSEYVTQDIAYSDGTVKSHINPSYSNITIAVYVSADVAENGFFVGENTYISSGTHLNLYTETFTFDGKVSDITISQE